MCSCQGCRSKLCKKPCDQTKTYIQIDDLPYCYWCGSIKIQDNRKARIRQRVEDPPATLFTGICEVCQSKATHKAIIENEPRVLHHFCTDCMADTVVTCRENQTVCQYTPLELLENGKEIWFNSHNSQMVTR